MSATAFFWDAFGFGLGTFFACCGVAIVIATVRGSHR